MKNTAGTITAMKRIISQVKRCTPLVEAARLVAADDAVGHAAEIRAPPGGHDRRGGRAALHVGPHEADVAQFQRGHAGAALDGVEFLHRKRLPGETRLADEQVLRGDQADVGGNHVAGRQGHHVAGHEVIQRDLPLLPAAHHRGRDVDHRLQLGHGRVGPRLLEKPHQHAQQHDDADDDRRGRVAGESRK